MQYHARSLLSLPSSPHVTLIGYIESPLPPDLVAHANCTVTPLRPFPSLPRILFPLYAPLKVVYLALLLAYSLLVSGARTADVILVQNPPSIPVLAVLFLFTRILFSSAFVIIDWHNFGYTLLAYSLPAPLAWVGSLARVYERILGRTAHGHLAVTRAMANWLEANWDIPAPIVLHDRPPAHFARLDAAQRVAFYSHLVDHNVWPEFDAPKNALIGPEGTTLLPTRPALLVSSTSWTPDEDFGILLDAMVAYEAAVVAQGTGVRDRLPDVVLAITGRGPQRAMYEDTIATLGLRHVSIVTTFLPIEDYPKLLGAADLGISLHTSSSGLDLPMKVVDMFGAGLPVAAIGFPCLDELVVHDFNGVVFADSDSLASSLISLLAGFPHTTSRLDQLADGAAQFQSLNWQDNWDAHAAPLILNHRSRDLVFTPTSTATSSSSNNNNNNNSGKKQS